MTTLLITMCYVAFTQENSTQKDHEVNLWISGALQFTFADDFDRLGGLQAGFNCAINQCHFIQLKVYYCMSTEPLFGPYSPNRLRSIANLSLLYGRGKYLTNSLLVTASAGLSYGKANYRGEFLYKYTSSSGFVRFTHEVFDTDLYNYIGLPMNVNFMLSSQHFGIGLDIYANFHKHTDYGLRLSLHLGFIRNLKKSNIKPSILQKMKNYRTIN